jgi:hypothetical protein
MVTSHSHGHDHSHPHSHTHAHGPAAPHPAQPVAWSILRMTVASRFAAAVAVSAALWVLVWLSMK